MTFIDTGSLDVQEILPGWKGRFFHSETMGFASYEFSAGSVIHEHQHPNDEVWIVIEGELEVTVDGEMVTAGPGFAAVVPPNVRHSVVALADGRAIVVDHPRRDSVGGVKIG